LNVLTFLAVGILLAPLAAAAQQKEEYRAYWVDTFNTPLGSRAEIDAVIQACLDSNCNALFAQVRRRGDSWYLDSLEPRAEALDGSIDPLRDLIEQAHGRGIEVHAFVIVTAIYNAHPTVTGLPKDPNHVFNQHFWDSAAGALYGGERQWSTRALPHNLDGTSFDGHRFGSEWYIDLGHPAAAAYTVDVLTHLVRQYDVDGIHLDRIRYPEAPIDAPFTINVGYNETSVQRFKARHGSAATYYDNGYPRAGDPLWSQWRRDQVTNFVRRLYLEATAAKPDIKVSAALITYFTIDDWTRSEPYYRVFQDWKAWAEEGILDILAPMVYRREHSAGERQQFIAWTNFTRNLAAATGRHAIIGLGGFVNSIEGTLAQIRRVNGSTILFSLANTNAAVTNNPISYPTRGVSTPRRPNSEYFAAVRSGLTAMPYEPSTLEPVFKEPASIPGIAKLQKGHLKGFAPGIDSGSVVIDGPGEVDGATDGQGFFGAANLQPGLWRAMITLRGERLFVPPTEVRAGTVATVTARPDGEPPAITISLPAVLVTGEQVAAPYSCFDELAGIATCSATPIDTAAPGEKTLTVTATDRAGNSATKSRAYIVIPPARRRLVRR
jgi:uncharacterized lipoprotein YddW (UPF0748 family)